MWLWDTALKFFGRAFSLRHQITWFLLLALAQSCIRSEIEYSVFHISQSHQSVTALFGVNVM